MRLTPVLVVCLLLASPVAASAPSNDAPFADAGLDRSVGVGETVLLDGGGSVDPDGRLVHHDWRVETPSGGSLVPADPTAETTRFRPTSVGRYTVTLTVTDDDGAVRRDALFVDVGARADADPDWLGSNDPPTGRIEGPTSVPLNGTATFEANVTDPDGRVVSYRWSTGETGRTVTETFDSPAGAATPLTVTVTDDDGTSARLTWTVDVRRPDATDRIHGVGAVMEGPTRVAVGETATYVLRAEDPDADVDRREWDPGSATTRTTTYTFTEPGTHVVRGRITEDGAADWASTSVDVYAVGEPGTSISGPDTAPAGSVRTYRVEAFDPDGGPLTVSWSSNRSVRLDSESGVAVPVRIPDEPGTSFTLSATVTDDEGETATVSRTVAVADGDGSTGPLDLSPVDVRYVPDEGRSAAGGDGIDTGSYELSVGVGSAADAPLTATWRFADGTVTRESLGTPDGPVRSSVRHVFRSDDGVERPRTVRVTVTDAAGHRATKRVTRRVRTVAARDAVTLDASAGRRTSGESVTVLPGMSVSFETNASRRFRVAYGDATVETFAGGPSAPRFTHAYDTVGTHTVRLTTARGPNGHGTATVTVHVVRPTFGGSLRRR